MRAVIGTARLTQVDEATPQALWSRVSTDAGVTRAQFDAYFAGSGRAYALHLVEPRILPRPVALNELRTRIGVNPPQSFRYLNEDEAARLLSPPDSEQPGREHAVPCSPVRMRFARVAQWLTLGGYSWPSTDRWRPISRSLPVIGTGHRTQD